MNKHNIYKIFILAVFLLYIPTLSFAQSLYGDFVKPPTDFKRGFYMGTDSGLIFFLSTNGIVKNPGYNLAFFLGHDLSKYLSIEGRFRAAISSTETVFPLNGGMYAYQGNGLMRFSLPIKRFFPFVDAGAGVFLTDPDYETGIGTKYNIELGFGAEYYTYQRHFSMSLRGSYIYVASRIPDALVFNLCLKYTF
jgi:hypothetical protein